ncbi:MAG: pyrroline-5-carboxylate reductase [Gammaproteobacteria bacterium]
MSTQQSARIAFIGAGNMAASLVGGMLARGFDAGQLTMTDISSERLQQLKAQYGVAVTGSNADAARNADVILLAVKPQQMAEVCTGLAPALQGRQPLVVSIAAGIPIAKIQGWLGGVAVVRCMPNTPALVQMGATGLYASAQVSAAQRALAQSMLDAVGIALWLDSEDQIDAVTALSGSGPAYFFLVMEAMIAAGRALGLDENMSRQLTLQTALGAAQMAITSSDDPAELRRKVTSPGGTTQAALNVFEAAQTRDIFLKALLAARDRSRELAG